MLVGRGCFCQERCVLRSQTSLPVDLPGIGAPSSMCFVNHMDKVT